MTAPRSAEAPDPLPLLGPGRLPEGARRSARAGGAERRATPPSPPLPECRIPPKPASVPLSSLPFFVVTNFCLQNSNTSLVLGGWWLFKGESMLIIYVLTVEKHFEGKSHFDFLLNRLYLSTSSNDSCWES